MIPSSDRSPFSVVRWNGYSLLLRVKTARFCLLCTVLLLLLLGYGLTQGEVTLSPVELWHLLCRDGSSSSTDAFVVWQLRLPRLVMAITAGALLGIAGGVMQSTTRNGLADPGLLGIKEAASLLVLLQICLFPTSDLLWRPLIGIAAALSVALLVVLLARDVAKPRFVLIGIGMSWGLSAMVGVLLTTLDPKQAQMVLLWMTGSLSQATFSHIAMMAGISLPLLILLLLTGSAGNTLLLGEQSAKALGVAYKPTNFLRFIAPVMLTAVTVSCVGSIGFIGLVAPHLSRRLVGGGESSLLLGSGCIGALLLLAADTLGRLAFASSQIPAGIIVALLGGPFLLFLLWRNAARVE